jgi:ribosome-associated translation inhibitor RaiA
MASPCRDDALVFAMTLVIGFVHYPELTLIDKGRKMDKDHFPVEFNNEIDDVKKRENEFYTLAVDRLSKLAGGQNDISGAVVNFKQPAQSRQTAHIYEVTIVVYMGSDHIAATEKSEQFQSTLDGALDAVERQVRERRKQQRNY